MITHGGRSCSYVVANHKYNKTIIQILIQMELSTFKVADKYDNTYMQIQAKKFTQFQAKN